MNMLAEILGWYGAAAMLGAYALLSFKVITADRLIFQFLNLTGSIGIIIVSISHDNYSVAIIDVVWALVAMTAIVRIVQK